uniref:Sperm-activating peptide (Br-Phe-2, Asn-3 SAP-I) n=1 Tax=Tripneustes gratilla TaxID=7673 RepID=Q7M3U0_TRIGR|nr:sperm-activating peptide I (3-Asn) [Tripneustes gratilla]prf//1616199G sperm-activating peptide I (2-Phe(Br),3-Asn) [Tripneustes gratilla]
GFNLNGGGVG